VAEEGGGERPTAGTRAEEALDGEERTKGTHAETKGEEFREEY